MLYYIDLLYFDNQLFSLGYVEHWSHN